MIDKQIILGKIKRGTKTYVLRRLVFTEKKERGKQVYSSRISKVFWFKFTIRSLRWREW